MTTQNDWNRGVIEEFRNYGGKVGGGFEGAPLLLLHTVGAKSGQPRVNPVMYLPDGDRWIVFASKAGAPTSPDWYHNLVANPEVSIEVGTDTIPVTATFAQARIHRWTGMGGVRTAEGGEGVTGAMIRARIWVDGRLAGGLQALLGAPMAAYSGCGERDGGIGHGKRRSRTGLARVCGDVGLAGGSVADGRRQAGSGMARSRARARLNCSSQGQRRGRCRVNRRAERVIRPAKAKTRRLRVLVVTIC